MEQKNILQEWEMFIQDKENAAEFESFLDSQQELVGNKDEVVEHILNNKATIVRKINGILGSQASYTDDVYQNVYLKATKMISVPVKCVEAYVHTILRNECYTLSKRLSARQKFEAEVAGLDESYDVENYNLVKRDLNHIIEKCFLPPRQKEAIYLLASGLRIHEIADKMKCKGATVRKTLEKTMAKLRSVA
jgi:RNA polymerase sigma factor (sigma-70 family)